MDKAQAIQRFWEQFNLPAYDENTVDDSAVMPYITYGVSTGSIEDVINLSASVWYRSSSWTAITKKVDEIAKAIAEMNPPSIKIDGGRLYLVKGSPFAQRMDDPSDDSVRRIYLNLQAEFLTNY